MQTIFGAGWNTLPDMQHADQQARQRKRKNYIDAWIAYRGIKPGAVLEATGAGKDLAWKWRKKDNFPTEEYLSALLDLLQTDRESLFHPPPGKAGEGKDAGFQSIFAESDQPTQPVAIDVPLLAMVSAGRLMQDDVRDEARDVLHVGDLPPGDWIALEVDGTSMDRISPPGSRILVNRKDKRLVPNACYVIDDGEGNATYKRYRPDPDRFEPVSTFEHETLFPENEPTVVGRVRFSILPM